MREVRGRSLTEEELKFCEEYGLNKGFDDDDFGTEQYNHICWPYFTDGGAICKSERLWFSGHALGTKPVECDECITRLGELMKGDRTLLQLIKVAGDTAEKYFRGALAASQYLWIKGGEEGLTLEEAEKDLRDALTICWKDG